MVRRSLGVLCAALLAVQGFGLAPARADEILVFAAASLKNALDEADAAYTLRTGVTVTASYAASGALAKQIENGAPADLFLSADGKWMDVLSQKALIAAESRADLLGNRLVLVAPAANTAEIAPAEGLNLRKALGDGRLAIGDPAYVPAGTYARAALQSLGLWDQVQDRLATSDNVSGALALVSRGEAPLGIVYATDVGADPRVRIAGTFPASSHPPIVYPLALTKGGNERPAARAYACWLRAGQAAASFRKWGFTVLETK